MIVLLRTFSDEAHCTGDPEARTCQFNVLKSTFSFPIDRELRTFRFSCPIICAEVHKSYPCTAMGIIKTGAAGI